jgi:predicted DNA-binding transcriptional regulator
MLDGPQQVGVFEFAISMAEIARQLEIKRHKDKRSCFCVLRVKSGLESFSTKRGIIDFGWLSSIVFSRHPIQFISIIKQSKKRILSF